MAPSARAHHRSHSLLLFQKLLNQHENASPLSLVFDTLEQGGGLLVREIANRAKNLETKVIYVSFETIRQPQAADVFIRARRKPLKALRSEVLSHCQAAGGGPGKDSRAQRSLIVIDSLAPLAATEPHFLIAFLSGLVTPTVSVLAVYHVDIPLVLPKSFGEYSPDPVAVLAHMATAILRVSSLYQAVEKKRAQNRSQQDPEWGLREGIEGVLVGLKAKLTEGSGTGMIVEMELRRRSGRAVVEKFVMGASNNQREPARFEPASITLLSDHPLYALPQAMHAAGGDEDKDLEMDTTFNLGLTDKQRRDRDGVVLPYFDAQTDVGAGEGGRILYEMGREDDFDDEEDEI